MRSKVIEDADVVIYVVFCDPGDEAVAALEQFARAESVWKRRRSLPSAALSATVGWFDHMAKDSRRIPVEEQCEVLSLIGDVAEDRDGPSLNVHVVLGLSDGTTRDGHLIEGRVFPTLEVVVTENPAELCKVMHPELGIARIDLDRSGDPPDRSRGVACPAAGNPCGTDRADQGQERSCLRSE
ncbi:MAG TPA: PPC domain-containing DNA-binding protein [Candidatus Solibacter sp.]|nr:PPC domain-containing DNA-binding protein [Candidatus Solibacter sp.]